LYFRCIRHYGKSVIAKKKQGNRKKHTSLAAKTFHEMQDECSQKQRQSGQLSDTMHILTPNMAAFSSTVQVLLGYTKHDSL
jgi:hypothetical protein